MKAKDDPDSRKEEIFKAAVECFIEFGYNGSSMDLIAERAGITKRGLYYHFKSKDELFIKLFHYMNAQYYEKIPAYITSVSDPEKRLLLLVDIAREMTEKHADFLKFSQEFMAMSARRPEIRDVMTAYYREQVGKVRAIIEEGIREGKFVCPDAEKMARGMVLMTMGTFNVYFSLKPDFDLPEQHGFDITQIINCLKIKQA